MELLLLSIFLFLLLPAYGLRRRGSREVLLNENAILRLRIERLLLQYERERFLVEKVLAENR